MTLCYHAIMAHLPQLDPFPRSRRGLWRAGFLLLVMLATVRWLIG